MTDRERRAEELQRRRELLDRRRKDDDDDRGKEVSNGENELHNYAWLLSPLTLRN